MAIRNQNNVAEMTMDLAAFSRFLQVVYAYPPLTFTFTFDIYIYIYISQAPRTW